MYLIPIGYCLPFLPIPSGNQANLFSVSVALSILHISYSEITPCVVFCNWLILSSMLSRFVHDVSCSRMFYCWIMFYCMGIPDFLISEHADGFPFLAIVNNAMMNIHVQVLVRLYVFISLGYLLGMELLSYLVTPCLTFWENVCPAVPKVATPV